MFSIIVALVMYGMLYLALFPIVFFWLRLVRNIVLRKDYSEVGLRKGQSPPNPKKLAPFFVVLNSICALILMGIILYVPVTASTLINWDVFTSDATSWDSRLGIIVYIPLLVYNQAEWAQGQVNWVAVAGSTIWMKMMLSWALTRQAHLKADFEKKQREKQAKKRSGSN